MRATPTPWSNTIREPRYPDTISITVPTADRTSGVVYCYEDQDTREAARIMEENQIRRLLVFDRNQRAVGIVSLGDIATRIRSDQMSGEILGEVSKPSQPHA